MILKRNDHRLLCFAAPGPGSPDCPGRPWQTLRWHNLTVAILGKVHGNWVRPRVIRLYLFKHLIRCQLA
ncbi:hypothetical protein HYQ44_002673 [Verticillium longisporum]|nr:hypothetical protein HYQ44_002673 [Verticillium longisporum]